MNSEGLPRAGTRAKASASGEWLMSPPRMLNSQAMESSSVSRTASAFSRLRVSCSSAIFSFALSPGELGTMRDDRR